RKIFYDTRTLTPHITTTSSVPTATATFPTRRSSYLNVGVVGVQFFGDGALLGAEDTVAPYSISLDTTTAANGTHTLTAVARDAAGNRTTSALVTVTVFNDTTPPTVSITSPASGDTVS